MKHLSKNALRVESLESRRLLAGLNCDRCEDEPFVEVASALVQSGGRSTFFGSAREIALDQPRQTIRGGLSGRPIDVYLIAPSTTLEVTIETGGDATVVLTGPHGRSSTVGNGGTLSQEVMAGEEYLLYAYDANPATTGFSFDVSVPALQPVTEFPAVAYVGRGFDWNLNAVNAPEVWAQGFAGEGTLVAVIDTGVDYLHPDLDDNIWINPGEMAGDGIDNDRNGYVDDIVGWDFAYGDNDPSDRQGHGTHVAGTIAAERNGIGTTGVAYDATILPVKVLRDNGVGSPNAIAAGIRYAVDVGADVINLSLGGGVSRALVGALQYAFQNDVLVVAAAGNEAASIPGAPAIYSSVLDNTISVGAHDQADRLAGFSNRVGNTNAVQIDAPGARIASTSPGGGYRYLSGTSMAAPHVAGVAALALSAQSALPSTELRQLLVDGAHQLVFGSDSIGGVNASQTVAQAVSSNVRESILTPNQELSMAAQGRAITTGIGGVGNKDALASAIEDNDKRRRRRGEATTVALPLTPTDVAAIDEAFADMERIVG